MATKLKPLKYDFYGKAGTAGKRYEGYEQVVLEQDGCPQTMFHIDLLWTTPEHREIHERLSKGETVEVEMFFKQVQP